jgi:aerotolerance regulator-like protein/VWA domain-containing protein
MNWLNPLLLFGALLGIVPIVIHLLNKTKYKVEPFGAMMFLVASVKVRASRIKLQQLLLLLLRILFFVFLALALARPVIMPKFGTASNQPVSNILIIDDSFSMHQGEGDNKVFSKVRKSALRIIDRMSNADNMQIIIAGQRPKLLFPRFSYDKTFLRQTVEGLKPGYGTTDVVRAMEEALWSLENSNLPVRRIYFLTDGQKNGWGPDKLDRWKRLIKHIKSLKIPVAVYVYNHEVGEKIENIAPVMIFSSSPVIDTFRKTTFIVEIANYSGKLQSIHAEFKVDGNIVDERDLSLGPGISTVHFDYLFKKSGSHYISVAIAEDDLEVDNTLYKAVHVMRRIPVLILEGKSSRNPWDSSAQFAKMTLDTSGMPGEDALFDVTLKNQIEMDSYNESSLEHFKSIILADVTSISEYFAFMLEKFVDSGGGVLIATGKNTIPAELNRLGEMTSLMPAAILKKKIYKEKYFHPKFRAGESDTILEIFAHKSTKVLTSVKVKEFWEVKPGKQASIIATFKNDPFIVHKNFGKGTVMLWTTSLNADWNNFPVTPDYLPLLQNLIIHLSSSVKPPVNILPGEPLLYSSAKPITGGVEIQNAIPENLKMTVVTPDGKKHQVKADQFSDEQVLQWEDTWQTGLYTVKHNDINNRNIKSENYAQNTQKDIPNKNALVHTAPDTHNRYFSVIADGAESDLSPFDAAARKLPAAESIMQFIENDNALYEAIKNETGIVEWWKMFIFAAIALLCLELFISWRFNG